MAAIDLSYLRWLILRNLSLLLLPPCGPLTIWSIIPSTLSSTRAAPHPTFLSTPLPSTNPSWTGVTMVAECPTSTTVPVVRPTA